MTCCLERAPGWTGFTSAGDSGEKMGANTVPDPGRDHYRSCHFFRRLFHVWRWCEEGEEG